ncbi:MAG: HAMP domain-containing histidine kinase [Clostridia bacterium]|nr:HAMP domain-containing histidine kinase [Clostridia bacterium]
MIFITIGLLIYVFSKNLFARVLTQLKNEDMFDGKYSMSSYKTRMFLQFFPLVLLMGTFVYLITSAVEIEEKGDILFDKYATDLNNANLKEATTIDELKEKLHQIKKEYENDTYFIITKDKIIYQDTNEEISDFFRTYTWFWNNINHTYGYYASTIQGAFELVTVEGETYAVGVMYYARAHTGYIHILATVVFISGLIIVFLIFFARDFSKPITRVSEYMKRLASGESVDYNQKLPVTSSDEIGELTINFNKILDKEKQYVETIKRNQDILVENERLSSLGQLIGGIAHNLKTPIMSVSGYLVAMENLANEYQESIGNPSVNKEDFEDITKEMKEWIEKSKDYMGYMTEVINAAKGQAVSMNANTIGSFTAQELLARTQILMREELMKYKCNLNIQLNISEDTEIHGELSAIVQVLDNLISNAMQAYGDKEGDINLTLNEDQQNVYISIQDFAGGIPEHIKDKLFKEMITTKGKDGTGLGLYMCYSTIKGKFNGDMKFKSETGVGTTFYITLNKVK